MAATISYVAESSATVATSQLPTSSGVSAGVGDWLVVFCGAANDGAGGASSIASAGDSDGVNVYTQRAIINYDPGSAGAGATLGVFTCHVTQALSGSDTVHVNFSPNTTFTTLQVYKVVPGVGETIEFIGVDATGSTGSTSPYTAPTVSVTNGDIIFGAASIETDDAITGGSDTTNGSWSGIQTRVADGGADASCMTCSSQYKTVTATGNQSWECTSATGRDSARTYLILRSAAPVVFTPRRNIPVMQAVNRASTY